jgi:diguanylate cyclase (GGDEF)-like protein
MAERGPKATPAYRAGIPLVVFTAALVAWLAGLLQPIDSWLNEQRFKIASRSPTGQVVVVAVDQKSLEAFGSWPLPRTVYGRLFDGLNALGAAEIALDINSDLGPVAEGAAAANTSDSWLAAIRSASSGKGQVDFGIRIDEIEQIPVVDVLTGKVARDRIAGKSVIVGGTADEVRDLVEVPRFGLIHQAVLDAATSDAVLQGRLMQPSGVLPIALLFVALGLAFAFASEWIAWTTMLAGLAGAGLAVEVATLAIQSFTPFMLQTAGIDVALVILAVAVSLREAVTRGLSFFGLGRDAEDAHSILHQVITDSFAGMVIVDERGRVEAASRSASDMLAGAGKADLVGRWLSELAPPELSEACRSAIANLEGGQWHREDPAEVKVRVNEWQTRIIEYVATPSRLGSISRDNRQPRERFVCCLTLRDVTEQREAQTRLAYIANFDPVTGLANRRQFNEHLARVLGGFGGERCAVICLDLDRFKNVNDTLGHRSGDLLLKQVAERSRAGTNQNDLVARLGGDEYAIVLTDHGSEADIGLFTEALIERLAQPYEIQGHRVIIGASAGVAFAWLGKSALELMKNADTALYRAKADGGNCYRTFEPQMNAALRARQALELDCWDALEHGQFSLVYQPQVDLNDGHMTGVEALLRWNHPKRGWVSPVDFIPVAEDTGMIELLGAWVLKEACTTVANWPGDLKIAVNVSPVQFQRGDLVAAVSEALRSSNLPPDRLDLEITESLFVTPKGAVTTAIDTLRRMGVKFSLDDFGTGYSSLSYLRKFPVNKIKIDKSFVQGIPQDREALAVIRAVATLAQNLGIRMNAEGIEEEPQVHLLRMLGCTEGQGYFFGKPQSADDIAKRIEAELALVSAPPWRLIAS